MSKKRAPQQGEIWVERWGSQIRVVGVGANGVHLASDIEDRRPSYTDQSHWNESFLQWRLRRFLYGRRPLRVS